MYHYKLTIRILTASLLFLLLAGCNSSNSQQVQTTPGSSPSSQQVQASPGSSQLTVPGLFTISGGHFFGLCSGPALATNRLTYTKAELQEMYNYLKNNMGNMAQFPPPKTLKVVDGAPTTSTHDLGFFLPQLQDCLTFWEMTNIGQKPIQLAQVHMKLLANTTEADTQYRLVDFCSVLREFESVDGPCPGLGGQTQPISYTFGFGPGKAGSFIQGQSAVGEPVINPGKTLFLQLRFLPANPSAALIYSIEPEFVINTSGETGKIFDLSPWKKTFVMAPVGHFGCYKLQGSTFVSAASVSHQGQAGAFCF